eukprot:TRINITY_DN1682_c0_g1_i1.p1 TRINITY_DN1682_c0_g1~~TRINITY_DN1682_c0_g1_i1.p1  ORF type:complete len:194 (+),score=24.88 TRINITY_DN1682_c0_g1_i1:678-1259(+)
MSTENWLDIMEKCEFVDRVDICEKLLNQRKAIPLIWKRNGKIHNQMPVLGFLHARGTNGANDLTSIIDDVNIKRILVVSDPNCSDTPTLVKELFEYTDLSLERYPDGIDAIFELAVGFLCVDRTKVPIKYKTFLLLNFRGNLEDLHATIGNFGKFSNACLWETKQLHKKRPFLKKEKSTDCDSALIPLLCVHG